MQGLIKHKHVRTTNDNEVLECYRGRISILSALSVLKHLQDVLLFSTRHCQIGIILYIMVGARKVPFS